ITLKLDYDPFIAGIRFSSELLGAHIERRSEPIWKAIPLGIKRSWETLVLFKKEVFSWISGDSNPEFSGPIGIAQITGEVASAGIVPLIAFTALLSLNLAILNILPIPALDGGRLLFIAIEVIRGGKRIKPEREALVHMVGFMMLILLIIIISYNDILRIIQGDSLLR
ncbi:MAG: site-2 protease family protein, partial [Dehalococcoidia bacterium]